MSDSDIACWKKRAATFNKVQWLNDNVFYQRFIDMARLNSGHRILDVGTGTGKLVRALENQVEYIIGIDNSVDMLAQATPGTNILLEDARSMGFGDAAFDKVLARMVLHHITEGMDSAMGECYRVLRPGGSMIVAEVTPARAEGGHEHLQPEIDAWFTELMSFKENRLTLDEYDIVQWMANAGFRDIEIDIYFFDGFSIAKWLEYDNISSGKQRQIMRMYTTAPECVGRAYYLSEKADDFIIQVRHAIVVGTKPAQPRRSYEIEHMMRHISDLLAPPGKVLYIGASHRTEGLTELKEMGHEITVLEIWLDNAWLITADARVDHVIEGDVRDIASMDLPHYDIAFWWHGPEHLPQAEVPVILGELEKIAGLVILGCPNGPFPLGPQYGNPHEAHISAWYAKDFQQLGYKTEGPVGTIGVPEEHLLSWKGEKC